MLAEADLIIGLGVRIDNRAVSDLKDILKQLVPIQTDLNVYPKVLPELGNVEMMERKSDEFKLQG